MTLHGLTIEEAIARAAYCAAPNEVDSCIKICSAVDISGIGVRVGAYLQALAFFALVLLAPDDAGVESVWVGMSVSYSLIVTAYITLWQGIITSHHCIVAFLLAMLPYVSTMSAMNSLTAYRGLTSRGMRMLQFGLLFKTLLAAILWALILYSFFVGQLPEGLHLQFKQAHCIPDTKIVVLFIPVSPADEHTAAGVALIVFYTLFWVLCMICGSYWTFRAPIFLKRNGEALQPTIKVPLPTGDSKRAVAARKRILAQHPQNYKPLSADQEQWLDFKSISKGARSQDPSSSAPMLPKSTADLASSSTPDLNEEQTDNENSLEWTHSQIKKRHHFFIWPVVAILIVLNIVSVELQISLNDIYPGEMEWDFPGTLSTLLVIPTGYAVFKAAMRIRNGKEPTPFEREQANFYQMGRESGYKEGRRMSNLSGLRRREEEALEDSSSEEEKRSFRSARSHRRSASQGY